MAESSGRESESPPPLDPSFFQQEVAVERTEPSADAGYLKYLAYCVKWGLRCYDDADEMSTNKLAEERWKRMSAEEKVFWERRAKKVNCPYRREMKKIKRMSQVELEADFALIDCNVEDYMSDLADLRENLDGNLKNSKILMERLDILANSRKATLDRIQRVNRKLLLKDLRRRLIRIELARRRQRTTKDSTAANSP